MLHRKPQLSLHIDNIGKFLRSSFYMAAQRQTDPHVIFQMPRVVKLQAKG